MQNLEALHHQAMEWVDRATLAKQQGNTVLELECLTLACEQERSAADLVADRLDLEPTRSVLHRSAAALAVGCAQLREAERLIGRALAGNPPSDIADELRDLLVDGVYGKRSAI
jgi:phage shock protein A